MEIRPRLRRPEAVCLFSSSGLPYTASLYKHIDMSSAWETLGLLIKHVQHRTLLRLEAKLGPLGVSMIQWNALRTIDLHPELCMHRLAQMTFNSDQAFGTLATRLLRLGLIKRRPGVGRTTLHELTPKGQTLLREGRALVQEGLSATFAPLSKQECAHLEGLLTKLLADDAPGDP